MAEFFHMGGYGVYIWPSFGIVAVVMTGLALQSWHDLRTQRRLIAELEADAGVRAEPQNEDQLT